MKRLNTFAAIACLTLTATLVSAQDTAVTTNQNIVEDPVADLTARIMQQFFPDRESIDLHPNPQQINRMNQVTAATGNWPNLRTMPNLSELATQRLDSILPPPGQLAGIEQRMQQLRQKLPAMATEGAAIAQSTAAMASSASSTIAEATAARPQAIAVSVANGLYAIEATIEAENGPQKVRLNGTKAEIQNQIRQLDPTIREALGVRLGM